MNILLDANICIDAAVRIKSYSTSLTILKKMAANKNITLGLAASSYTTVYYIISKSLGKLAALEYLDLLKALDVKILSFTEKEILLARTLKFKDFEDACIAATAILNNCKIIATRNLVDFKYSPIKAKTPDQLLKSNLI